MKLSRTAWLILGSGIFVIAFASLYMLYRQQGREQERLNDSLLVAQATLPTVVSEKEDWQRQLTQLESQLTQQESQLTQQESQLAQATSRLDTTQASFPESVESIEYDELLFNFAHGYNLRITTLISSEPGNEEVEDITFSVTSFTVDVKGEVAGILGFINVIVTSGDFTCATAELVDINIPEPLTEAEKEGIKEGIKEELTKEIVEELVELFDELDAAEKEAKAEVEAEIEELFDELDAAEKEAKAEAEAEIEELEMASATIRLVIYGYKGE